MADDNQSGHFLQNEVNTLEIAVTGCTESSNVLESNTDNYNFIVKHNSIKKKIEVDEEAKSNCQEWSHQVSPPIPLDEV